MVDFTHLTKLTHVEFSPPTEFCDSFRYLIMLPLLVTTIRDHEINVILSLPLPKLQHYSGRWDDNIPWRQLKTAAVDFIEDGTRCCILEEVEIKEFTNFQHIHCPNLRSVVLNHRHTGIITDFFTHDQINRLKTFKGKNVELDDLTMLEQVKVLHVTYNHTLTNHTPLPPHLKELKIYSHSPVEGIPDQLTVFEYYDYIRRTKNISVTSATLKRLLIDGANVLTFNCPHLEELMMDDIRSCGECFAPKVRKLSVGAIQIPLQNFPNLRQLHMLDLVHREFPKIDVVIGHYLESVTVKNMKLDRVVLSANEVTLVYCSFRQTPAISAKVLKALRTSIKEGITCQELICDTIEQIPDMVEKASLSRLPRDTRRLFSGCNKLTSVSIDSGCCNDDELVIPASVVQLKLPREAKFRFEGTEMSKTPQKLKYFHWEGTRTENQIDHTPEGIKNRFEQIESNWCHRDKLRLRQPLNI